MKNFYLVTNDGKDVGLRVTGHVKEMLEKAGNTCFLCEKDGENRILRERMPERIDCAIVIGGDGTLIEAARALYGRGIPVLGINMGSLGYLTEVELSQLDDAIAQMLRGHFVLENRMMIEGTAPGGKTEIALNDIVVNRKGLLRLIHFNIFVNGELLNFYEADGIIISTPTGSTAYNLSAGGPIVKPTTSLFVLTPICPHSLNSASIVLSADDEIVVEIGQGRNNTREQVNVSFDGADVKTLATGERLTIRRAACDMQLMKLSEISFLEILRRKMRGM